MKNVKKLDMATVHCPICHIGLVREGDEVNCPKCGFGSPILIVNHRRGLKDE